MNKKKSLPLLIIMVVGIVLIVIGLFSIRKDPENDNKKNPSITPSSTPSSTNNINDSNKKEDNIITQNLNGIEIVNVQMKKEVSLDITFEVINNTTENIVNKTLLLDLLDNDIFIQTIEFEIEYLEVKEKTNFGISYENEQIKDSNIKYQFHMKD